MSRKIHEGELRVQGKGVTVRGGLKECLLGYTIRCTKPGENGRLYVYGRSEGRRYMFVVLERLAPRSFLLLSARSLTPGERRKYGKALKENT